MAQWVKDPALLQLGRVSLLGWGFNPWLGNFNMLQVQPKKKKCSMQVLIVNHTFFFCLFFIIVVLFLFLWPQLPYVEVPGLGVESELQLPAHTTATAILFPGDLCHTMWQRWTLNPLSKARDQTHILIETRPGS